MTALNSLAVKFAAAEPLLRKGYEGMKEREKKIPPQAATRIPEALDRLVEAHRMAYASLAEEFGLNTLAPKDS
jgi:hypothetical protein